jgi:hypothetical protein
MCQQAVGVFYALEPAMHLNKSRVEQRTRLLVLSWKREDKEGWICGK